MQKLSNSMNIYLSRSHHTFIHNFVQSCAIFKILSPSGSAVNFNTMILVHLYANQKAVMLYCTV